MYYFIVNMEGGSGRARATWREVSSLMKEKAIPFKAFRTKYEGHATILAEKISLLSEDDIRLIAIGGDGTINEVLNGICDFEKVKFGVIPTGSGNDFARGLGLPKTTREALDVVLSSIGEKRIDIGHVTADNGADRLFGISSGIGLDAIVCKKVQSSALKKVMNKLHLGSSSYVLITLETLLVMKMYKVNVEVYDGEGQQRLGFGDMIFLAAMNFPAEGGGVPMAPDAVCDDGKLSICAANGIKKPNAYYLLTKLMNGKHGSSKGISLFDAEKVVLTAGEPMVLHADGEYLGDVKRIEVECLKRRLRVLV